MSAVDLRKFGADTLWTVSALASELGVCGTTVRKAIRDGGLKAYHRKGCTRQWFVKGSDVKEWLLGRA